MIFIPSYKDTKNLCHGLKAGDNIAIKMMADFFMNQNIFNSKSILIPSPNHNGYADYTLKIAEMIACETGARICDVLRCEKHEPLYEQKKKGTAKLSVYRTGNVSDGNIFFIDNVLASGLTFFQSQKAVGKKMIPIVMGNTRGNMFIKI